MIESLTGLLGSPVAAYTGLSATGIGVAWALKKIPNKTIKAKFGGLMYGLGVTCTLGLARFSVTKGVWNKVVEPYIIDAIDNIFVNGVSRFVEGLRSDNG